jgi:hypothetical protein
MMIGVTDYRAMPSGRGKNSLGPHLWHPWRHGKGLQSEEGALTRRYPGDEWIVLFRAPLHSQFPFRKCKTGTVKTSPGFSGCPSIAAGQRLRFRESLRMFDTLPQT